MGIDHDIYISIFSEFLTASDDENFFEKFSFFSNWATIFLHQFFGLLILIQKLQKKSKFHRNVFEKIRFEKVDFGA